MFVRLATGSAILLSAVSLALAAESWAAIKKTTHVEAQDLGPALELLAKEHGFQVLYRTEIVRGLHVRSVDGMLTTDEALHKLLKGTDLTYRYLGEKAVTIVPLGLMQDADPPTSDLNRGADTDREGTNQQERPDLGSGPKDHRLHVAQASGGPNAPHPSAAQDAPAADVDTQVAEVTVTALRRSESLQSAPLSIAAISADSLAQMGANQINDYYRQIPNLNATAGTGGANRLSIRGVTAAGEATVGVYYDETPVTGPSGTTSDPGGYAADLDLFDVERVEVLRGPQGTLYGSSSMAGTLKIIFNKPDYSGFKAATEDQVSSTQNGSVGYFYKGMVNMPLISNELAVRIVGYDQQRPGWIDSVHFGTQDVNNEDNRGMRTLVGFTPGPNTTITSTVLFQKSSAKDMQGWFPSVGTYETNLTDELPFTTETDLFNLTGKQNAGFATLTATASFYKYAFQRSGDFTPVAIADSTSAAGCKQYFQQTATCTAAQMSAFTAFALSRTPVLAFQPAFVRSQDYEARLSSNDDAVPSWLQWTVGTFFENRYDHITSQNDSANPANGAVIEPLVINSSRFVQTSERQVAGFGELTFKPTDKLTVTTGLRYYDYHKNTGGQVLMSGPIFLTHAGPYTSQTTTANGALEKFNVSYDIAADVMTYATASKGFRPGGANNIPGLPASLIPYKADSLWNYEVGLKSGWLNNRVTLNTAVFDEEWSNMQTSAETVNQLYTFVTNAGKARIRGTEIELNAVPYRGLSLSAGVGYTDAKLTQNQSTAAVLVTASTGLTGDRIPNTPEWTASTSAEYKWPLADTLNGLLRADFAYTGDEQATFAKTDPNYLTYGGFGTVNLRAGIQADRWEASFFCQNASNRVGSTSVLDGAGFKSLSYGIPPRTMGLTVRYAFE